VFLLQPLTHHAGWRKPRHRVIRVRVSDRGPGVTALPLSTHSTVFAGGSVKSYGRQLGGSFQKQFHGHCQIFHFMKKRKNCNYLKSTFQC
jgi:hypothetical protein